MAPDPTDQERDELRKLRARANSRERWHLQAGRLDDAAEARAESDRINARLGVPDQTATSVPLDRTVQRWATQQGKLYGLSRPQFLARLVTETWRAHTHQKGPKT